jgi:hypothetical protein
MVLLSGTVKAPFPALRYEELNNLYSPLSVIRIMKAEVVKMKINNK